MATAGATGVGQVRLLSRGSCRSHGRLLPWLQKGHGRSDGRRRASAKGRERRGRPRQTWAGASEGPAERAGPGSVRTWAEEWERPRAEPNGRAWSTAAACTAEPLAAPAGSSEGSRAQAGVAAAQRDVRNGSGAARSKGSEGYGVSKPQRALLKRSGLRLLQNGISREHETQPSCSRALLAPTNEAPTRVGRVAGSLGSGDPSSCSTNGGPTARGPVRRFGGG